MLEESLVKESDQRFQAIVQVREQLDVIRNDMKTMGESIKKQPASSFTKTDPRARQTDRSGKKSIQNST